MNQVVYEQLTDAEQLKEIVRLQELVWGGEGKIPIPLMLATIRNGGVIIGARTANCEQFIGFVYGFPSVNQDGSMSLYSHMLAIAPEYRNVGIGKQLKIMQKEWARSYGYSSMKWTFDPLEIKNGYINLHRLGGVAKTYTQNYYGDMEDKVNKGIPSDRLLLEWKIDEEKNRERRAITEEAFLFKWKEVAGVPIPVEQLIDWAKQSYRMPVPTNIQELKLSNRDLLLQWRLVTRKWMTEAFAKGYMATDVVQGEGIVSYYVVEKV